MVGEEEKVKNLILTPYSEIYNLKKTGLSIKFENRERISFQINYFLFSIMLEKDKSNKTGNLETYCIASSICLENNILAHK